MNDTNHWVYSYKIHLTSSVVIIWQCHSGWYRVRIIKFLLSCSCLLTRCYKLWFDPLVQGAQPWEKLNIRTMLLQLLDFSLILRSRGLLETYIVCNCHTVGDGCWTVTAKLWLLWWDPYTGFTLRLNYTASKECGIFFLFPSHPSLPVPISASSTNRLYKVTLILIFKTSIHY